MSQERFTYLNDVWNSRNTETFRSIFNNLAKNDKKEALKYLNSEKLPFPCLYVLIPEIDENNLYTGLSSRNLIAFDICAKKTNDSRLFKRVHGFSAEGSYLSYETLKWIFNTSVIWNTPEKYRNGIDSIIDGAAALLIMTYDDRTILSDTVELIFKRYRKGLLIHDLVWCYMHSPDPDALKFIAQKLLSDNKKDNELSCLLLNLPVPEETRISKQKLYKDYLLWLKENSPFIYFTEEYFQNNSNPRSVRVDIEAKYICKRISPKTRNSLEPMSQNDIKCLLEFKKLNEGDKEILASYSNKLHKNDIGLWTYFMQKPIYQQLIEAKENPEVLI